MDDERWWLLRGELPLLMLLLLLLLRLRLGMLVVVEDIFTCHK